MRRRCRQLRKWRARWKRRNKEIKIKTLHRMIIAHDRMSDVSGNDRLLFNFFENRHFREVSFYEAFIWFSPFFNGIWHDPGAHFPKEFSMGQHRHFSYDCRVQYVLPMRFYAFSSGRITVKQLPSSTWLDTSMVPCIRSMIRFVMESPSPLPFSLGSEFLL